jgi:hypothetical protein
MADLKDPKVLKAQKEPKDLNQRAPPDNQARPEKAELSDEDLEKLSGGVTGGQPCPEHHVKV